jgi:long-chain acyl-CoA synthetase
VATTTAVLCSQELTAAGNRFAQLLDDLGVAPRGSIAVLAGNEPAFMQAYRGATWSGRRFTPMSWRWSPDEVAYVVGNCEADVLVVSPEHLELVRDATHLVRDDRRLMTGVAAPGWVDLAQELAARSGAPIEDAVAGSTMLYTSGTTGRPKGVRREPLDGPPPGDMGRGGRAMLEACLGDAADRSHLVCTPLYHSGPLSYADGASLLGADLVLMNRFDAEEVLAAIQEHRISSTFMVPTQFVRLLRLPDEVRRSYDLSSLQMVVHGSAPVAVEVKRAMIEWLGPILFEFYGGTEGGGVSIDSATWLAHPGSVGRPRPGLALEIRDEDGPVPAGREGEVWFNDSRAFEYKDDPDKTAEAVRDGWFTIGDIGFLDDDGFLYLCDRRADVIISGGVNIYPAQIEAALLAHPAVADCCVVGFPDDDWGESIRAVIEPTDADAELDPLRITLLTYCRDSLPSHQVPRQIDFDRHLPRTETGKLARRQIRNRYWDGRERRI